MSVQERVVHVVNDLGEADRPKDGDVAVVVVPSDRRDGYVHVEGWVRVAGRWVPDE